MHSAWARISSLTSLNCGLVVLPVPVALLLSSLVPPPVEVSLLAVVLVVEVSVLAVVLVVVVSVPPVVVVVVVSVLAVVLFPVEEESVEAGSDFNPFETASSI